VKRGPRTVTIPESWNRLFYTNCRQTRRETVQTGKRPVRDVAKTKIFPQHKPALSRREIVQIMPRSATWEGAHTFPVSVRSGIGTFPDPRKHQIGSSARQSVLPAQKTVQTGNGHARVPKIIFSRDMDRLFGTHSITGESLAAPSARQPTSSSRALPPGPAELSDDNCSSSPPP
jgi:hypothetical protein